MRQMASAAPWVRRSVRIVLAVALAAGPAWAAGAGSVTSLGRIEPADGVIRLAGPSGPGGVIASLEVAEGDWVDAGQVVARLDDHALKRAAVAKASARLENAKRERARVARLSSSSATSAAKVDAADLALKVAEADLAAARAGLELTLVRSPLRAEVLEIHTRPGERVGPEGVLELGRTDRMYAVAEVYETDIARVTPGSPARLATPALSNELTGTVERVGLKIGKMDVLGTDPVAKADARVVEVYILLDDPSAVAHLTNLQVEVAIDPAPPSVAAGP